MLSLFKKLFTGKPASTGTESLPSVNQEKKTKPGSVTPELQASPNCPQPLPVQSDISKNNRAEGNYLLMEGIRTGSVEKVRQALEVGADVNYEIEELPKPGSFRGLEIGSFLEGIPMKRNALDIAVNNGYMEVAKFLMQNGAILPSNYSDEKPWETVLLAAAKTNRLDVAALALEQGADVNCVGLHGINPLMLASMCGHESMVTFLLYKGADLNAWSTNPMFPGKRFRNALMWASSERHDEVAQVLTAAKEKELGGYPQPPPVDSPTEQSLKSTLNELQNLDSVKQQPKVIIIKGSSGEEVSFEFCPIPAKDFCLGKYPVTQQQCEAIMGNNPSHFKGERLPVETVSWNDVQIFIQKLNLLVGKQLCRLPTEDEWEYSCRAGSTSAYYFGDDENRLGDYAWYFYNSIQSTSPLGQKKPNAWGLYDMTGNVWEWTDDWYDNSCSHRVIRGGSWSYDVGSCRSAYRCGRSPGRRSYEIGFRLVFVP